MISVSHALACLALLLLPPQDAPIEAPTQHALMIFVDGFVPDAIAATDTPHLDRLLREGAWSLRGRAESTTISGSGWTTFLTGVHWDRHGIPDNEFRTPRTERHPSALTLLESARPDAVTAIAQCWEPIQRLLVTPAPIDHRIFHDYDASKEDYFDADSCDTSCVDDLVPLLRKADMDLAVMMFGELDGVGHLDGNRHYHAQDELYQRMLRKVDAEIGRLLAAIEARPGRAHERWLVVLGADHAGSPRGGHGQNVPEHREIPIVVWGDGVHRGPLNTAPKAPDLVATVLAHLGVEPRPEWLLDGRPVGLGPEPERPLALDVELLRNGDAEEERGFAGFEGVPDASVVGWEDPGWMTVVPYGTPGFPPARDGRAGQFFAANDTQRGARLTQRVDLATLAAEVERGVEARLAARLGNRGPEAESLAVHARFLAQDGSLLGELHLPRVSAAERAGRSELLPRSAIGPVPAGTCAIEVVVETPRGGGPDGGFADDVSLRLTRG